MPDIVNVAAYQFVPLDGLPDLRETLRQLTRDLGLKGTILLSREGINLFVAGATAAVDDFLAFLRGLDQFCKLEAKLSPSEHQPFNRMLVKIKQEIIPFGNPRIDPARNPAPKIKASDLKLWFDEGRAFTLLDVRNNYEIALGSFDQSMAADIDHFRQFPQAIAKLDIDREKPVVMFCTGGIRCEKAAPFMLENGFKEVYHLDGGILKYFEEIGGEHFRGECFVFDKRVALDASLVESETAQCFVCQSALSTTDLQSHKYELGRSCPHCYLDPEQQMHQLLKLRQQQIAAVTSPLPGSEPYDNARPLNVAGAYDGHALIEFLTAVHPHIRREEWSKTIAEGRIQSNYRALVATELLRAGQRLVHLMPQTVEPPVNPNIRILFEDSALIVVDKPAPLPVHPCGRFNRNSLVRILDLVYRPLFPRPQHRLDANTTGIVVLAKTRRFAANLQSQFERQSIRKLYLAKVIGHPTSDEFSIELPISSRPIDKGRRVATEGGTACRTDIRVLARLDEANSILAVRPQTGRTNQIRIHMWESKHPIVGDPIYGQTKHSDVCQTLSPDDPPMCLHHWQVQLEHPITGATMCIETEVPPWAQSHVSAHDFSPHLCDVSIGVSDDTLVSPVSSK